MNKLMSAPRDPPEWGVGVGCVGSDHGLLGPKRIALSVSIRVICVRCLIAAYPMFNGQCSMFKVQWSMVNVQCSMVNGQWSMFHVP